jgi:hypothetical protein
MERGQAAERQHRAAAIPAAAKRLPKCIEATRAALAQLDEAVTACNELLQIIATHADAGTTNPLGDEQLRELYELRESVWTIRHIRPMRPALKSENDYLRWPLVFDLSSLAAVTGDMVIHGDLAMRYRNGPKPAEPVVNVPEQFIKNRETPRRRFA